ncbi:MAG: sensor histidine kinase [Alphaproteobacteria bacterium]|jgi:two-component system sensor histidine kinase ChvG|nr:sensor histidine kinase [Alphaproteobacteria bacterium]MDP6813801.1 sensor histidine kinase [Alphaproteobacteria bacterium]
MPLARHRRRRRFSTLTLRILAPNVLALALLVGGIFYLDQYRDGLLDAKIAALQTQAEVIAGALGESALTGEVEDRRLDREIAARIIRRLVVPTGTRARLYDRRGGMLADSRELIAAGRHVQLRYLPPADAGDRLLAWFHRAYDWLLPRGQGFPPYRERPGRGLEDFPELTTALGGEVGGAIRAVPGANLILGVAVPVQPLRQVVGALLLSADDSDIEDGVRNARLAILQATALALTATVLLSIFLAGTIAGPVRRLAAAADRVRRWRGRRARIPDLGQRHDEIGDLSVALHEMTEALYARLDAIEVFAADVAHEIKNPLTSLRSALESIRRTDDIQQKARLLAVMEEDVQRLDRLISDISNASRVDAELARADSEPVDLAELLRTLVQVQQSRTTCEGIGLELQLADEGLAVVEGVPGRLGQVVDNLVGNARSFSPPGTTIRLALDLADGMARLRIDDDGRGIPAGREEAIFQRFYSQRPDDEAFGRHSGLGLSICRQIVEAHGGTVEAENRQSPDGEILGARFTVRLPLR